MEIDIGISKKDRKAIADGLSRLLADTYTLYLKTHNFHWNVEGPMFNTLHLMFETQYTELALAVDGSLVRREWLGRVSTPAERPGVSGDPRRASVELGRLGAEHIVEASVTAIRVRTAGR